MALDKTRLSAIANFLLDRNLNEGCIRLNPREMKDMIDDGVILFAVTVEEMADVIRTVLKTAYDRTLTELDAVVRRAEVAERAVLERARTAESREINRATP